MLAQKLPCVKRIGGAPFARALPNSSGWRGRSARRAAEEASPASGDFAGVLPNASSPRQDGERARRAPPTPCTERANGFIQLLLGEGGLEGSPRGHGKATGVNAAREWVLVQELEDLRREAKDRESQAAKRKLIRANAAELIRQKEARKLEASQREEARRNNREETDIDVERFWQEEEEKRLKTLETKKRLHEEVRQQLDSVRGRRLAQREQDARDDEMMMAKAEEARVREEEKDAQRKQRQREQGMEVAQAALSKRQQIEEQKRLEVVRDKEMAKRQAEMLLEQELRRQAEEQKRKDRLTKSQAAYEASVGNERQEKMKADEERAKKWQEQLMAREHSVQERKKRALEAAKQVRKAAVDQQLQEHERRREQFQDEKRREAEELKLTAKHAQEEEADRQKQRRQRQAEHREQLLRQIQEQNDRCPDRIGREQMDDVERRMNRSILDMAKDPTDSGLRRLRDKMAHMYRHAQNI